MDWKLVVSTFAAIFLAELGDKTQITAFSLATGTNHRWSVFLGASLALATSTLIAVLIADQFGKHINVRWTQSIAGMVLIGMGVMYLVGAWRTAP